jgi:hypothetical protein
MSKPTEIGESTKITADIKTIGIIIAGAVSLALMYTDLNKGIEEAKIREQIMNTAKQVEENSDKLDKIDEKLYEIIQR